MQKAKSRLKTKEQPKTSLKKAKPQLFLRLSKKYLKHLPLLFLSVPFYSGAYYIFTKVHPDKIQHFLIPNTYLPLQFILFLGNFLLFSYLFLKTRYGFKISLLISSILFFKLQLIDNYWQPTLIIIILLILSCLFDRFRHHST